MCFMLYVRTKITEYHATTASTDCECLFTFPMIGPREKNIELKGVILFTLLVQYINLNYVPVVPLYTVRRRVPLVPNI
jgi:hypothetical protein